MYRSSELTAILKQYLAHAIPSSIHWVNENLLGVCGFIAAGMLVSQLSRRVRKRYPEVWSTDVIYPGATLRAFARRPLEWEKGAGWEIAVPLLIWLGSSIAFGPSLLAVCVAVFLSLIFMGAVIDMDNQILPDEITGLLVWSGLISAAAFQDVWPTSIDSALVGVVAGYAILWLVSATYSISSNAPGVGHGDLKFLAGIGAWLGVNALPAVVVVAALVQVGLGLFTGTLRKQFAFGPALGVGGAVTCVLAFAGVTLRF